MSEKLFGMTLQVKGPVDKPALETFAKTQEQVTGIRGTIKQKAKDLVEIYIEGTKAIVEKVRDALMTFASLVQGRMEVFVKNMVEIKNYKLQAGFTVQ